MVRKTKIIENIDNDLWIKFAGLCKMKDIKIGHAINDLIMEYLEKEGFNKK